ncbi:MAG: DUF5615 family PIN-like protein [Candidatus Njordarchaeota archaeon]
MREKLSRNKFLADDNIPRSVVEKLKSISIDITRASDYRMGLSDEEIVIIARTENRIIITFDSDFGEILIKRGISFPRLIYLDFEPRSSQYIFEEILTLLEADVEFYGAITVFDGYRIRQRRI